MSETAHPLSQRFEPAPHRSLSWLLPLLIGLFLVACVSAWLHVTDTNDREAAEQSLISDTLSLENLLRSRIEAEQQRLNDLAQMIASGQVNPSNFATNQEVLAGLRRRWLSVTWLDADARAIAQASGVGDSPQRVHASDEERERRGLSSHLQRRITGLEGQAMGQLVVRYSLTSLLLQETPWWISLRYVVRLVDGFGEVRASNADASAPSYGMPHRISFDPPFQDVYLELQHRAGPSPWYNNGPLLVVIGVLGLLCWATYFTWRRTHSLEGAEAAWQGEAAWRRAMEDALTVGLRARDMQGRLLYVNRRFCELTGFSSEELVGREPPMPYWPKDKVEEAMQRHLRNMAGGAPAGGYETRWCTRDGREIVVMLFEAPLTDPAGHQIGWLGSVIDVTEHRRAEERERQRIENAANQSRLMTLGEIAAALAHQLNQPLAAIASYSAGLRNALAQRNDIDPKLLAALDKQGEQAAQAGRIVERIRSFLSRRAPQQERCDMRAVIDNAASLLHADLKRRGITLQVSSGRELPLQADPVLLEQVIVNLVRNAADAVQNNPPSTPGCIDIDAGCEEDVVWVQVSDNGAGLGGRHITELSMPFYSTKTDGMGLGLSICRSIVEAHVGTLDAFDRPPPAARGACFRCTLPLASGENA